MQAIVELVDELLELLLSALELLTALLVELEDVELELLELLIALLVELLLLELVLELLEVLDSTLLELLDDVLGPKLEVDELLEDNALEELTKKLLDEVSKVQTPAAGLQLMLHSH